MKTRNKLSSCLIRGAYFLSPRLLSVLVYRQSFKLSLILKPETEGRHYSHGPHTIHF